MTEHTSAAGNVKLVCREDCGNAPRKKLLLEWNVALVNGDFDFLLRHVTDTVVWDRVGVGNIQGKDRLIETLESFKEHPITELRIDHIITHGYTAALHGMMTYGGKRRRFCDVYVFNGASKQAKIKEITTYAIEES
jgi:hypothetical protein